MITPEEARFIAEHPALVAALAELETTAIEKMINCGATDDMTRRHASQDVRAIRALRDRLAAMSEPATEPAKGPSPYA